jgi:DNA repair photolyase
MVILERRQRRGPILTSSSLPCLGNLPTINLTEGCVHGCLYCYTQGYSGYPGHGRVILFENIPSLVKQELPRKRKRPQRVYFSPSSDAFQPLPEVQQATYETMATLLSASVEVAFLTKGVIDDRFLSLFAASPSKVFAQIGITTLDERLCEALEPRAATPSQRLQNATALTRIGVATKARLDPLIPGLTDTDGNLRPLLAALSDHGIRSLAASYLFLRPAFSHNLCARLRQLVGPAFSETAWYSQALADGVGRGLMPSIEQRQIGFTRLRTLAAQFGIDLHICACKNPDLACAATCQIAGPTPVPPTSLFAPETL